MRIDSNVNMVLEKIHAGLNGWDRVEHISIIDEELQIVLENGMEFLVTVQETTDYLYSKREDRK